MKKIFALIMAVIMAFSLVACGGTNNDSGNAQPESNQGQETVVVKNPVRSELYDSSGKILADISYEYDADGKLLSNTTSWNYDFGSGSETDTYTYDSKGNVATKTSSYSDSDYASVKHYEYDADNRLVKEYFDEDYGIKYVYGDDGRLAEVFNYNADGALLWQTYSYEGNAVIQTELWGSWTLTYITYYDEQGNPLKWVYESDGTPMLTHIYTYDAEGKLTKQDVSIESWKMEGYVVHYYE